MAEYPDRRIYLLANCASMPSSTQSGEGDHRASVASANVQAFRNVQQTSPAAEHAGAAQ